MFEAFPKINRLSKKAVVTEKIDGTNGQIYIPPDPLDLSVQEQAFLINGKMMVGSRNRWLNGSSNGDNFGFYKWAQTNYEDLLQMGHGRHFGEWWGDGIGPRKYGIGERRFSLFNTSRWLHDLVNLPSCVHVVPIVGSYPLDKIDEAMMLLKEKGSLAAPGFMNPEGIIIYHERNLYKKTYEFDEGKWSALVPGASTA